MKKLLSLCILICLCIIKTNAQFSTYLIQPSTYVDAKSSAISVVHSSGYIYNIQASNTEIYIMKLNASTLEETTVATRIVPGLNNNIIKGGFEDPDGNIIIYGSESYSGISYGLIYKISVPAMTISNTQRVAVSSINYGCWGERMNSSGVWERAYAFITSAGRIIVTNNQLTLNANQYYIQNAKATQISWHEASKKFVCSGYTTSYNNITTNLPFLIIFDCKASYTSGWYNYFKFVLEDPTVKINSGIVAHSINDNNTILLTQSFKYQNYLQPIIQQVLFGVMLTPPYLSSVILNNRNNMAAGGTIELYDMKKNLNNNKITLLGKYTNTSNITKNLISSYQYQNGTLSRTDYKLNDESIDLKTLEYNSFDESGSPLMMASGTYKTADGVIRCGAILFEHYTYITECQTIWGLNKTSLPTTTFGIITDTYNSSPLCFYPSPSIYNFDFWGAKGICGEYHTGLPDKSLEKSINTKNEINITLLESQEFILQGFTGSVQCNIYDMTGKMVYSVSTENDMNNSIPTLSSGIYILKAVDNHGNNKTIKFFKD